MLMDWSEFCICHVLQNKSLATEVIDLERPATFNKLKERLRDARVSMDRNKTELNKYAADPEVRAINAEVNAIRKAKTMREQSLVSSGSLEPDS